MPKTEKKEPHVLVLPEDRFENTEEDVESLADQLDYQLAELAHIIKKNQAGPSQGHNQTHGDRVCFFCKKPGHAANNCSENSHRDTKFFHYNRMANLVRHSWSRHRSPDSKVNIVLESGAVEEEITADIDRSGSVSKVI